MLNYEYALRMEGQQADPARVEPVTVTVQANGEQEANRKMDRFMKEHYALHGYKPVKVREFGKEEVERFIPLEVESIEEDIDWMQE